MKVRLTRKLADYLDGIDVRNHDVGDVLELSPLEAQLLIAERWALHERRSGSGQAPAVERRRSDNGPSDGTDERSLEQAS